MKVRFTITLAGLRGFVSVYEADDSVVRFRVTDVGALIIERENEHACWSDSAYAPGEWISVVTAPYGP
jgi:hypothetical protein